MIAGNISLTECVRELAESLAHDNSVSQRTRDSALALFDCLLVMDKLDTEIATHSWEGEKGDNKRGQSQEG